MTVNFPFARVETKVTHRQVLENRTVANGKIRFYHEIGLAFHPNTGRLWQVVRTTRTGQWKAKEEIF